MPCNNPLTILVKGNYYQVPCRWCMGCRIDKRNMWNNRIRWEVFEQQKKGFRSSFVTLTYNELNYRGGVCKKDIIDFNKRLREHLSRNSDVRNNKDFKYFISSEFGDENNRGHYHGCYVGLESNFLDSFIRKTWKKGFHSCKPLLPSGIAYTVKYLDKQIFGPETKGLPLDAILDFPFTLKSKGIGANYLKENSDNALESGVIFSEGKYIKFPSYYAKKFGVDTAILNLKMQENLEYLAKYNGMSVSEYLKERAVINERKCLSRSRLDGHSVTDKALRIAETKLIKSNNEGELLASELLYENE